MGASRGGSIRLVVLLVLLLAGAIGAVVWMGLAPADTEPDLPGTATRPGATAPSGKPATGTAATKAAAAAVAGPGEANLRGVVRVYRTKAPAADLELTLKFPQGDAPQAATVVTRTGPDGVFRY